MMKYGLLGTQIWSYKKIIIITRLQFNNNNTFNINIYNT